MPLDKSEMIQKKLGNKERDGTVDIIRGICILIMIWGHVTFSNDILLNRYFSIWYHAFHMPVFYIISGYFFDHTSTDEFGFIRKKTYSLLIPYFAWGGIHIAWKSISEGSMDILWTGIQNLFLDSNIHLVPFCGAIWFLLTLFWINIIYFFINRIFKHPAVVAVVSLIICFIGVRLATVNIHLPFCLDAALVGVGFMAFGRILRIVKESKYEKYVFRMNPFLFLVLCGITNSLIFYNGMVKYRSGYYKFFPLTFLNVIFATVLLWNISRVINEKGKKYTPHLTQTLSVIGKESLIFVCLNIWFNRAFQNTLFPWGDTKGLLFSIIIRIVIVCMIAFCCYITMRIISCSDRLKILAGKMR